MVDGRENPPSRIWSKGEVVVVCQRRKILPPSHILSEGGGSDGRWEGVVVVNPSILQLERERGEGM